MLKKASVFCLFTCLIINFCNANGFYVGGGADINISYPGGKYLKDYFSYNHAFSIKKGIIPGYNINAIIGYTFWVKNKSSLAIETNVGNSMIDYKIGWKITSRSTTNEYFKQRWNRAINWGFGFKYTYSNISLTVAPLFLFKINYIETTHVVIPGRYDIYTNKKIIYYGGGEFGADNESKLDLYIRIDYSIKFRKFILCPYLLFQPGVLYIDNYDFGPFTNISSGRISAFSAGVSVYYNIKSRRR